MSKKRLLWLCITAVWVSISAIYYSNYNHEDISLSIGDGKKVDYKIVNIPFFSFVKQRDFISIDSYDDICNNYVEKGVIDLTYEYNKKFYVVNGYRYFDINDKFKYGTPIKIKLETKKNIKKCRFWVDVDPGKANILLIGIVFGWIPLFMVLANIVIPILEYIDKKTGGITKRDKISKLLLTELGVSRVEGEKIYKYHFRGFLFYLKITLIIGVVAVLVIYYLFYSTPNDSLNFMNIMIGFMYLCIMFVISFVVMCYKFILFLFYKRRS